MFLNKNGCANRTLASINDIIYRVPVHVLQ